MSKFKDEVRKKKLPEKVTNSPEWNIFLKFIDAKKMKSKKELAEYLDTEIQKMRIWLAENRAGSAVNRLRREKTRELEMMDVFRMKILPYL
jgi:hypothetical protein